MPVLTSTTTFPPIAGQTVEWIRRKGVIVWQRDGGTGTGPDQPPPAPPPEPEAPNPGDPPAGTYLRTRSVANNAALGPVLSDAIPGDDIVLANGSYSGFTLAANGTATNPIRIRAENPQQALITGRVFLQGNYNRLRQVQFDGVVQGDSIVEMLGTHGVFERSQMLNCRVSKGAQRGLIRVGGSGASSGADSQVIYNRIYNFGGRGVCVREANLNTKRIRIARCWFKKSFLNEITGPVIGFGGDNASTFAMVRDTLRESIAEYNLFENLDTAVSTGTCGPQAKNSGNTFQFNTMRNAGRGDDASAVPNDPASMRIEIRVAQNCVIRGNYMDRCSGPLIFGDNHVVDGNRNTGAAYAGGNWSAMGPARGNCTMDDTAILGAPGGQPRARNCIFAANTGLLYAGHTNNSLAIQNCYLEGHTGSTGGPNAGLLIPRAPTFSPAIYVILTPSDVGVSYGL